MLTNKKFVRFEDDNYQLCVIETNEVKGLTPNEDEPRFSDIHYDHGYITVRANTERVAKELGLAQDL